MNKVLFSSLFLLGVFSMASAQIEKKMEKEGVVKGSVFKDGEEIEGYIQKMADYAYLEPRPAPWKLQGDIRFIAKDVFEKTEKIKGGLYKKYGPKDIGGYRYEDMYYEAVKYADMTAVGLNMIPKWMFLRRIVNGKISVFYHYAAPAIGEYLNALNENVVYRKGTDGKLKLIFGIKQLNIDKDMEDCPFVQEKLANNEYESRITAAEDYNANCK